MTETELDRFLALRNSMKIAHHIPGRIRLKIGLSVLKELGPISNSEIDSFLNSIDGIKDVRINKAAGSVVIAYAADKVEPSQWDVLINGDSAQAVPLLKGMLNGNAAQKAEATL